MTMPALNWDEIRKKSQRRQELFRLMMELIDEAIEEENRDRAEALLDAYDVIMQSHVRWRDLPK